MKTKVFFVCIAILFAVNTNGQQEITESLVGKYLFNINPQTTHIVKSLNEANKVMNSGIKDFLLDEQDMLIRFLVLDDGRLLRIENEQTSRFYFVSQYYDENKINQENLAECWIDKNGKVVEISTKYNVDSKGKNGFVIDDKTIKEIKSSGTRITFNDSLPISEQDPLVLRYQKIVDQALELLSD